MAGFGGELIFFVALGYVVLGPQRMHAILQKMARAKREFDKVRGEFDSQLSRAMPSETNEPET
ncbi:MAG TPA: twin-arginine translocase TatA/TatE family subunit [Candidatus Methylomirabilis sp.]|nr:twin-arginine translocase TatA/TatE family subunit [Candidatus Methylomirabilis sp.]